MEGMTEQKIIDLLVGFSRQVLALVDHYLSLFCSDQAVRNDARTILKNKLESPFETRMHWLFLADRLTGGFDREVAALLGVAYEFLLLTMYHGNVVLDRKGGSGTNNNNMILTAILLQDYAFRVIHEFSDWKQRDLLLDEFLRVSTIFHEGQYSDVNRNILRNVDFRWNEKEYWRKIYMINAHMYESIARVIVKIKNPNQHLGQSIVRFGRLYGYLIQLVNDIIDFVPAVFQDGTVEKIPEDAYADIRNRHVTLPFYLYWKKLSSTKKQDFFGRFSELTDPMNETLARDMVSSGAIRGAQEVARRIARQCRKLIPNFPAKYREVLNVFLVMAYSNRFYKAFRKLK